MFYAHIYLACDQWQHLIIPVAGKTIEQAVRIAHKALCLYFTGIAVTFHKMWANDYIIFGDKRPTGCVSITLEGPTTLEQEPENG